jgi:hypothetical protein
VLKANRVFKVYKAQPALQVRRGCKVQQAHRVYKAKKAIKVNRE